MAVRATVEVPKYSRNSVIIVANMAFGIVRAGRRASPASWEIDSIPM